MIKTEFNLKKEQKLRKHFYLTSHTGINSKWIKCLNMSPKTEKFLEENIGITLSHDDLNKIF